MLCYQSQRENPSALERVKPRSGKERGEAGGGEGPSWHGGPILDIESADAFGCSRILTMKLFFFSFLFCFFFGGAPGVQKFPQGLNLCHSGPSRYSDEAGSLTL